MFSLLSAKCAKPFYYMGLLGMSLQIYLEVTVFIGAFRTHLATFYAAQSYPVYLTLLSFAYFYAIPSTEYRDRTDDILLVGQMLLPLS